MFKLARQLTTSKEMQCICIKDLRVNIPENVSSVYTVMRIDIWRGKAFKSI